MCEDSIQNSKYLLRKKVRSRLKEYSPAERVVLDSKLIKNFVAFFSELIKESTAKRLTILTYMPLPDEPNITKLFDSFDNVDLVLPISLTDGELTLRKSCMKLTEGKYGILEPDINDIEVLADEIDYAIIPGRAFSKNGERLGRGKGYYDRFLSKSTATTIALSYDKQIFDMIPTSKHDRKINYIITPSHIYS